MGSLDLVARNMLYYILYFYHLNDTINSPEVIGPKIYNNSI